MFKATIKDMENDENNYKKYRGKFKQCPKILMMIMLMI